MLVGSAASSVVLGRHADRIGRRSAYSALFVLMACAGATFAVTDWVPALVLAALTGTVSADVVESGPFTSLSSRCSREPRRRAASRERTPSTTPSLRSPGPSALLVVAGVALLPEPPPESVSSSCTVAAAGGLLLATRLSAAVEAPRVEPSAPRAPLGASRGNVYKLSGFFALDSFGGGFVVQAFVAYVFTRRSTPLRLGTAFFAVGILQALSFQVASRLAGLSAC